MEINFNEKRCMFCNKGYHHKLVGVNGVYICEECAKRSLELFEDLNKKESKETMLRLPKPGELKMFLDAYV